MRDVVTETVAEAAVVLAELVAVAALTGLGLTAERAGLAHLSSGLDPLALWLVGMGALALYAGLYALGYQTLVPRLLAAVDRTSS